MRVVAALAHHPGNKEVQIAGAIAVQKLAIHSASAAGKLYTCAGVDALKMAMRVDDVDVHCVAVQALGALATYPSVAVPMVGDGVHVTLATSLSAYSTDAVLATAAFDAMQCLALVENQGTMTLLQSAMLRGARTQLQNAEVGLAALRAFVALCSNPEAQLFFGVHGGLEYLSDVMRQHPNHKSIQHNGLLLLIAVAQNPGNTLQFLQTSGHLALAFALQEQHAEGQLIASVLDVLAVLTAGGAAAATQIAQTNAVKNCLACMRKNKADSTVQQQGCLFLAALAASGIQIDTLHQETRATRGMFPVDEVLCSYGAIECIAEGMHAHQENTLVAQEGCHALYRLSGTSQQRQCIIKQAGDVAVVAIKLCDKDPKLAFQSLSLASSLTVEEEGKQLLMDVACVEHLVNIMFVHRGDSAVETFGCKTIINLSSNLRALHMLSKGNAHGAVVGALNAHADAEVHMNGAFALGAMASMDTVKTDICKVGGVASLLKVLKQNAIPQAAILIAQQADISGIVSAQQSGAEVAAVVCETLALLVKDSVGRADAGKHKLAETVLGTMAEHAGNPHVQSAGCRALGVYAAGSDAAAHNMDIWHRQAAPALMVAMEQYPDDASVQQAACFAVAAMPNSVLEAFVMQRGVVQVSSALYLQSADVAIQACRALTALAEFASKCGVLEIVQDFAAAAPDVQKVMSTHFLNKEVEKEASATVSVLHKVIDVDTLSAMGLNNKSHMIHPAKSGYGFWR